VVAREWHGRQKDVWAESHSEKIMARLENDVFPVIGTKPIHQITAPELLEALRRIESRGAVDTAHRALQNCSQIFRYAIATGRAERDPAADLRGALPPLKHISFATITDLKEIGHLLRDIDAYHGNIIVRAALLVWLPMSLFALGN
jgi:integrase